MDIVRAGLADLDLIAPLRKALWPDSAIEELKERAPAMAGDQPHYAVLMAKSASGAAIGFVEIALRTDYVNGCNSSPVAFLEGIYVDPGHRRRGVARALVEAARGWARARGVAELASDALLDDEASHAFHRAVGFAETERVVCFHIPVGRAA